MSEALEIRAELLKLARLLDRDPATLAYLADVPAGDLRELRDQVTERLFTAQGRTLARLAAASKVLPTGLIATIGERAFGPLLSARMAGLLDPARAADVASKMPAPFLAEVAIELDPRRASDVIARIPPRQVAEVAAELVRRQDYVTLGRFVGHIDDDALRAALAVMSDGDLLRIGSVLEDKDRLDGIIGLVSDERLLGIVEAARAEELWDEAVDLAGHLSSSRRADLAEQARAAGVLDQLGPLREALL